MIFLVVVPVLAGFANFLVPLMIGAPDMAFPRLNALSYWLYLFGGIDPLSSPSSPTAERPRPAGRRTRRSRSRRPGNGQDLWILSLHILTVSSLAGAINFIVTIQNMRTRGMSWMRVPLFVWSIEVYAWLLVLVLPTLSAGPDDDAHSTARAGRTSSTRPRAAAWCSTSTPSGSSAIPRSTS